MSRTTSVVVGHMLPHILSMPMPNHRGLGSNDDDDDDDGSSAQPSHAQRFEPISEGDLEPYNMIRCQLSSNCKPSFQLDILNSCIENIFVSHTPACTFHEEASGIFAP